MDFRPLTSESAPLWDRFCQENSEAWFWQTTDCLALYALSQPSLETQLQPFYAWRDEKIVALCPWSIEKTSIAGTVHAVGTLGGDFIPAPVIADALHPDDRERVRTAVMTELDQRARQHKLAKVCFREAIIIPKFLSPSRAPILELGAYGYLDQSLNSQVIDLHLSEEQLWSSVRKSYHSLIHKAEAALTVEILDQSNVSEDRFEDYRRIHQKAAGRATRPRESFQKMLDLIRKGMAILPQVLHEGHVIASTFLVVFKDKAYYMSACNDPEWETKYALGHLIQWKTILDLKRRGFTHYELGWQFLGSALSYVPSKEEHQIASFKHAFGGFTVPFHRGVKYYSKDVFREDLAARLLKIEAAITDARV